MDKVVKYLKTHFNNSVQPQQDPLKQLTSPMEAESLDIIEEEKEDIQTIENYEEEETLHAEDLDDPYYWNLSKEQKSPIESILSSPKGTLQHLPPIPSFIVFSRSGAITRAIPLYYDLIPLKEVFFEVHRYDLLSQYFGDKWRSQQTQISQDYWKLSEQAIRISAGEQCLREWTALWKVLRRPPAPLSNIMPPLQALKDGRFIQSQAMFGLSPLPITAEYTNWRSLTEQQTLYAIQRIQFLRKQLAQTRLITREFFRRYQKNYQSMKELEQTPGVIVEKNKERLIMRAVFSSIQLIGRPMQMLQSDIPDDEAKEMYYLFKQAHTALRQFQLTVLDQMVKYQKFEESPIMRHVYPHFMQSIDQQLSLNDQYWIKYRDFIIKDNIGLRSNIDIRPKDDPQITGFLTKGLAQAPIKLSKKNRINSSEFSLDLISISEKLHFNRVHLQNDGKDLKLNSLFQSLVKINKSVQMVSKTKEIYKKIHLDQTEEKPGSEDENSFMSQFNHQALPMFIIKPVGTPQKKRVEKSEKIKQQDSQSTKVDPALKEIQKRLPSEFNQAIQIQQIIPSLDPQHHHQIDYSKNQHDKTREDKYDHKIERDHRSEKSEDYRNEREKEHKYRKDAEQKQKDEKDIKHKRKGEKDYEKDRKPEKKESIQSNNLLIEQKISHPHAEIHSSHTNDSSIGKSKLQPHQRKTSTIEDEEEKNDFDLREENNDLDLLKILNNNRVQKSQLQRAQFNTHFHNFNQNQKDEDWQENIEPVQNATPAVHTENNQQKVLSNLIKNQEMHRSQIFNLQQLPLNDFSSITSKSAQDQQSFSSLKIQQEQTISISFSPMILPDANPPQQPSPPLQLATQIPFNLNILPNTRHLNTSQQSSSSVSMNSKDRRNIDDDNKDEQNNK